MTPKVYKNQKLLRIIPALTDKYNSYTMFSNCALESAMLNLSPNAFKVYVYLVKQKHRKGQFALSKTDITDWLQISESSYHRAIRELEKEGYIRPDTYEGYDENSYTFSEWHEINWG